MLFAKTWKTKQSLRPLMQRSWWCSRVLSSRLSHNLEKMSNGQIGSSLYMFWQGMNVVAGVSLPNDQEAVS